MKVVVVDDMLLLREGLVGMFRDRGVDVVGEAASAEHLDELVGRTRPDVVILDIRMPPTFTDEGLVAAAAFAQRTPMWGSWCCHSSSTPRMLSGCSTTPRSAPDTSSRTG